DGCIDAPEFADPLLAGTRGHPVADIGLEQLAVPAAVLKGPKALIARKSEEIEHTGRNTLGRGRNGDPLAVGALIGTARNGIGNSRSEARLHIAHMGIRR